MNPVPFARWNNTAIPVAETTSVPCALTKLVWLGGSGIKNDFAKRSYEAQKCWRAKGDYNLRSFGATVQRMLRSSQVSHNSQ